MGNNVLTDSQLQPLEELSPNSHLVQQNILLNTSCLTLTIHFPRKSNLEVIYKACSLKPEINVQTSSPPRTMKIFKPPRESQNLWSLIRLMFHSQVQYEILRISHEYTPLFIVHHNISPQTMGLKVRSGKTPRAPWWLPWACSMEENQFYLFCSSHLLI